MTNGVEYEVKGTINHWGNTLKSGHYVAFLKNDIGQWWLCNDNSSTLVSLADANTPDNFIILLERKSMIPENVSVSAARNCSPVLIMPPLLQDEGEQYRESEEVPASTSITSTSIVEDPS